VGLAAQTSTHPRSSSDDKERVARRLRDACVAERISQETFARRLDLVYGARTQAELDWLLADLPQPTWPTRAVASAVTAVSRWTGQIAAAWRVPRTARLMLPMRETQLVIGRSRRCDCVIGERSVSRRHAYLQRIDGRWWLRDAGSFNGTWVNGWRVTDQVEVRPGDEVALGRARFILVQPVSPA
jgi:hypothetical protein